MNYTFIDSPVGDLLVAGDDKGLALIGFSTGKKTQPDPDWIQNPRPFSEVKRQLDAYFNGRLTSFELPLNPRGTKFQRSVWNALREIPYGETISYGELAAAIDKPKAPRAVGAANGRNPLSIVVPCHRVIGSTGKLTGFGGGLKTKAFLLDLEREYSAHNSQMELPLQA